MKALAKKLRKFLNEDIKDIVIFGSLAKGKTRPDDIDIMIISEYEQPETKEMIRKILPNADVQHLGLGDYDKSIFMTILREGYSAKHGMYLHEKLGIKPCVLYKYSLKSLTNSKKVMFERAIKNFENLEKLSNSVVLVPIKISSDFSDFLKNWDIDIDSSEYFLMPLLRKEQD